MIIESKCFPSDWIGGKLVKENDWCYFIDGIGHKQVSMPSGYGKPVRAYWISNGVLVMESDTNNVKIFMVGTQRYFPAYGEETEPHDIKAYRAAVDECNKLRAEEKAGYVFKSNGQTNAQSDNNDSSKKTDSNNAKRAGTGLGLGSAVREMRSAISDLKKISDTSEFEADANQIVEDFIQKQQLEMEDIYRRAEEEGKIREKILSDHYKEVDRLNAINDRFLARDRKKTIFSNLQVLFTASKGFIDEETVCKFSGINDADGSATVSRVMKGYFPSFVEVGQTEKFWQCWSEIFYLIEEGVMFKDEHVKYFTKVINNTCKPGKTDTNIESFEDYIKRIYAMLGGAFWGYCFAQHPKETELKDRLLDLEFSILPDEEDTKNPHLDNRFFSDESLGFVPKEKKADSTDNSKETKVGSTTQKSTTAEKPKSPTHDTKQKAVREKNTTNQPMSSDSHSSHSDDSKVKEKKKTSPLIFLFAALPFLILVTIAIIHKSNKEDMDFEDSDYELVEDSLINESAITTDADLSQELMEDEVDPDEEDPDEEDLVDEEVIDPDEEESLEDIEDF